MTTATHARTSHTNSEEKAEVKAEAKVKKSDADFAAAIATVASGVKALTDAGMGAADASRLSYAIWEKCND